MKDPDYAWIPAKLVRSSGNVADVQIPEYADEQSTVCDGGKKAGKWIEAEVDLSDYNKGVLPMQNVDENGNLRKFADMVELPFLHEVRTGQRKCLRRQLGCSGHLTNSFCVSMDIVGRNPLQLEGTSR